MSVLIQSNLAQAIQVMPLVQDQINLTSGTFTGISLIYCVASGDIRITWNDASTDDITMVVGDTFTVPADIQSVQVLPTSGTFHLA